jgi:alkanesulfonate monooxygenase SsuD/methylene tetrahydromethanopterin reductase-like flavin-dependent oxidoreductase (luciferase family)
MKFGFMGWLQLPKPWDADSEYRIWNDGLEQIELSDRIGIDYLWEIEHHFLEEYSHSSAGESFLAACSQRTKRIHLGSGICLLPPNYNHPARVAERVAALDLVSEGRAEFGTGESSTFAELDGFHVSRTEKRAMWRESLQAICRMMVEEPFRGHVGKYFKMPPRNVIPKPIQKPHPPVWVACSRQETIVMAGTLGLGVLTFGFLSPVDAQKWTADYYRALTEDCHPLAYSINPNVGFLSGFACAKDGDFARQIGTEGRQFFGHAFRHHYVDGVHHPAKTDLWTEFKNTPQQFLAPMDYNNECMGTPDDIRKVLLTYETAGVDQVILIAQEGRITHEQVCEGLELFGKTVVPEFKERDEKLAKMKAERLAPVIEQAMKRRVEPKVTEYDEDYVVRADGLKIKHFGWDPAYADMLEAAKAQVQATQEQSK